MGEVHHRALDMGGKGVGWGADPGNSLRVPVASVFSRPRSQMLSAGAGVCACAEALLWWRRVAGRGSRAAVELG